MTLNLGAGVFGCLHCSQGKNVVVTVEVSYYVSDVTSVHCLGYQQVPTQR